MSRPAAYVRYSSDRQRETSIDDQLSLLAALADRHDWTAPRVYTDAALSGTHTERPGLQRLLQDAESGVFATLLLEDLSRLSRDLGETDRLLKRLHYVGVRVLCADGFDSDQTWSRMQAGLQGLMNEAYIDDLARRTHRGQLGAVQRGHSAGGRAYGYRSEPIIGERTEIQGWRRTIDPDEAEVVRRIFQRYSDGASPYRIAHELNLEGVTGPRGGTWARSAIYPDKRSGVGILGNPIYHGELIWNRSRWVHVPGTRQRKRVARPESEWIRERDERLRIVEEALWQAVQTRIVRQGPKPGRKGTGILTGILVCGQCGAHYVTINQTRMGCAAHKERGPSVCAQSLTLDRSRTEQRILARVRAELAQPQAVAAFVEELKRARAAQRCDPAPLRRRLKTAEARIANLIRAIEAGIFTDTTRDALRAAEQDRENAAAELAALQASEPAESRLDPRMIYRRMLGKLALLDDKDAVRNALAELLGPVTIEATATGAIARIDTGHVLTACVENDGSGGRIRPISTWVEIEL
jgi:site-specific DNA recombinase